MPSLKQLSESAKSYKPSLPQQICSKLMCCITGIPHIVLGIVYLKDCPVQYYIPIYLLVLGIVLLVLGLLVFLPCTQKSEERTPPNSKLSKFCRAWNGLMLIGLICWFIAGNVWIYSIYEPNYIKNTTSTELHCNKTLYLYAFWTTTLVYILLGLLLPIALCFCLCACICAKSAFSFLGFETPTSPETRDPNPTNNIL